MPHGIAKLAAIGAYALVFSGLEITGSAGQTVEEFYRGKQVRFIIHSTPGGSYDAWAVCPGHTLRSTSPEIQPSYRRTCPAPVASSPPIISINARRGMAASLAWWAATSRPRPR